MIERAPDLHLGVVDRSVVAREAQLLGEAERTREPVEHRRHVLVEQVREDRLRQDSILRRCDQAVNPVGRVGVIGSPWPTPTIAASSSAIRRIDSACCSGFSVKAGQPASKRGQVAIASPESSSPRSGQEKARCPGEWPGT